MNGGFVLNIQYFWEKKVTVMDNQETKELWGRKFGTHGPTLELVETGEGVFGKKAYGYVILVSRERNLNSPFKDEATAFEN